MQFIKTEELNFNYENYFITEEKKSHLKAWAHMHVYSSLFCNMILKIDVIALASLLT